MSTARWFVARAAVGLVALSAGVVAWRSGGGADVPEPPPRASTSVAVAPPSASVRVTPANPSDVYTEAARLVDLVNDARIDAPSAREVARLLPFHWRKLKPPFVSARPEVAMFVSSVALRTSGAETQAAVNAGGGVHWAPDAKIWNMNEGSFDQRESLVAPTPSSFTYHLTLPRGAVLTFAEGTLNATSETVVFKVTVHDEKGTSHVAYEHRLPPRDARRWSDARCDLSAFAGRTVDVVLSTSVSPATDAERHLPRRAELAPPREKPERPPPPAAIQDAGADAAAPDPLASPSRTPIALWANPVVHGLGPSRVPYNVLWIVVDALRPDAIPSFHDDADDARKQHAQRPPLEALLPKLPGLTPALDDLARRGVRFTSAYSAGSWTRPGTLGMLAGARSSELGIDTLNWIVPAHVSSRFYANDPPLLPLVLRKHAVATSAFVNNYFMVGYAAVGVDMGFERIADHRYRTFDTQVIADDAKRWLDEHKNTRFFTFVNFVSPHDPYEPRPEHLARVPSPPEGPKDEAIRMYLGEVAKDDDAIGAIMKKLDETGLRDHTIVVVTADHGETMSSAHAGRSQLDNMPIRYHHAVSNYEETTRVPILVVAPGLLAANTEVKARVRSVDIAPTVLDLLGVERHPRMSGRSLVPLAKGQREADERVVVTEGRSTRGIMFGKWRLLTREGPVRTTFFDAKTVTVSEELFDLEADPGERHDVAPEHPEVVAEMKARLAAALQNVPVAGSQAAIATTPADGRPPVLRLRFAGGGRARRISGALHFGDAKTKATSFEVTPVDLGRDTAKKSSPSKIEIALATMPSQAVGFDITVDPPNLPVTWELYLDDAPFPARSVFAGPFGLVTPMVERGLTSDDARFAASASALPQIDPRRDLGLFVVREAQGAGGEAASTTEASEEGAAEMARLLREWGYAHGSK